MNLKPNRHDRGWSKMTVITCTAVSYQSWRFIVEAQGKFDAHVNRPGFMELIQWVRMRDVVQQYHMGDTDD